MHRLKSNSTNMMIGIIAACILLITGCGATTSHPTLTPSTSVAPLTISVTASIEESQRQGELLFNGIATCNACHTVNAVGGLVGPDLVGIAVRIVANHSDLSVEAALELEIVNPTEHVTENFRGDLMPLNYVDILTPQQIQDIVAYLVSLE